MSRMTKVLGAVLALMLVSGALVAGCGKRGADTHAGEKAARYHCPMHPTYTADRPGSCPICGMALTLIPDDHASGAADTAAHGAGGAAQE
jgi:hypothetical protein